MEFFNGIISTAKPFKMTTFALKLEKSNFLTRIWDFLKNDGRHFQILFQTVFVLFGIYTLGWMEYINHYFFIFFFTLLFQAIAIYLTDKNFTRLKSGFISSLSLCLMFKAGGISAVIVCAFFTIASKYLIKFKGKHIFNPTNFGIIATIFITQNAWISPGQWGSSMLFLILITIAGFSVLFNVGRLDTAISFLVAYSGLHFIRQVVYMGWEMDFFLHHLSSGTLLIFTFFMITDPVTSPNHKIGRIIWASAVGILAFIMTAWFEVYTAPLWALFIISPFTPLIDKLFKAKKFTWKPTH